MVHVRVVISTSPEMVIESLFQITKPDNKIGKRKKREQVYFNDNLMDYNIVYLSRISEYNHTCEDVSQVFEIDPEFCLCDDGVIHELFDFVKDYESSQHL